MSTVTLNGKIYEGVQPAFLDGITNRVSARLLKQRSSRIVVDQLAVTSELERIYGHGLKEKNWYKDFVLQFCRDRKIPCRKEDL